MKRLLNVLADVDVLQIIGNADVAVSDIQSDSRRVSKGGLFVAVKGIRVDGHDYIDQAIQNGAAVVVCEDLPDKMSDDMVFVLLSNTSKALGLMANQFFDAPSEQMTLVGITGTNGKTTCCTLLFDLFTKLGYKAGLISTNKVQIGAKKLDATHTTPDSIALQRLLSQCVELGVDYVFMEVSSHAIDQDRIAGLSFVGAVFTNITRDHLDYHETFEAYRDVKKSFFDHLPSSAFALSNADDKNGKYMLQNTSAKKLYYGCRSIYDYKGKVLESHLSGLVLDINGIDLHVRLVGDFNAYNVLAVYAVANELGIDDLDSMTALSDLRPAEGRFEIIRAESGSVGIVDYAHTPDALRNVLTTIKNIHTKGNIITVIGCGGDRDKGKRPIMAQVAADMSDQVILTSDNPRSESAQDIIDDMMAGLSQKQKKNVLCNIDRKQAIRTAVMMAQNDSVILVAGKGHEKYQIEKGVKTPFDDKQILKAFMQEDI